MSARGGGPRLPMRASFRQSGGGVKRRVADDAARRPASHQRTFSSGTSPAWPKTVLHWEPPPDGLTYHVPVDGL
jgi:hypothetical protein